MSSSKVEATTFGYYKTGSEEPAWMYWLTNVLLDTQPGRMMETLFLGPKIRFALFSMSLHLCQSWSKREIKKGGGEHWNMSGRTIPLKHDIYGKMISLRCGVHTWKFGGIDLGTELVNIESASFEIGGWKREGTRSPRETWCWNWGVLERGYQREKERSFLACEES